MFDEIVVNVINMVCIIYLPLDDIKETQKINITSLQEVENYLIDSHNDFAFKLAEYYAEYNGYALNWSLISQIGMD